MRRVAALAPFFLLALPILRPRRGIMPASLMLGCTAITLRVWCLLMLGPGTTVIHQGTYLTPVLAIAGGYAVFWAVRPALAAALGVLQMLFNAVLFIWLTPTSEPGVGMTVGPVNVALLVACVASVVAWAVMIAGTGRSQDERT
jgi:heme/copper-type cytochrome/quinol oxidase subunit 4